MSIVIFHLSFVLEMIFRAPSNSWVYFAKTYLLSKFQPNMRWFDRVISKYNFLVIFQVFTFLYHFNEHLHIFFHVLDISIFKVDTTLIDFLWFFCQNIRFYGVAFVFLSCKFHQECIIWMSKTSKWFKILNYFEL